MMVLVHHLLPSALEFINLDPTTSTDPYITVNNPLPIDSQIVLEDLDNPRLGSCIYLTLLPGIWFLRC